MLQLADDEDFNGNIPAGRSGAPPKLRGELSASHVGPSFSGRLGLCLFRACRVRPGPTRRCDP